MKQSLESAVTELMVMTSDGVPVYSKSRSIRIEQLPVLSTTSHQQRIIRVPYLVAEKKRNDCHSAAHDTFLRHIFARLAAINDANLKPTGPALSTAISTCRAGLDSLWLYGFPGCTLHKISQIKRVVMGGVM